MSKAATAPTPDTLTKSDLTNTFPDEYEVYLHGVELTFAFEGDGSGQITHLWVDPDLRGNGWGSALIELCESMLKDEYPDCPSHYMRIQVQNPGGVDKFLDKQGFVISGEMEDSQFDNPLLEGYKRF